MSKRCYAHSVKRLFAILLLATSAVGAESRSPSYSPVTGFSEALVPILTGFEKARIETTLRGFIARADSFPGFERSDMEPSEHGLYLNVAMRDATDIEGLSDRTEKKSELTHRLVQVPPPTDGELALVITLHYGRDVLPEVVDEIDKCIRGIIEFSKKKGKP